MPAFRGRDQPRGNPVKSRAELLNATPDIGAEAASPRSVAHRSVTRRKMVRRSTPAKGKSEGTRASSLLLFAVGFCHKQVIELNGSAGKRTGEDRGFASGRPLGLIEGGHPSFRLGCFLRPGFTFNFPLSLSCFEHLQTEVGPLAALPFKRNGGFDQLIAVQLQRFLCGRDL